VPVRLERLFLDDPEGRVTYLTIASCGFAGNSGSDYFHLTMRLNEDSQEADWAEKLLGQPFRFFGAYVISRTEDLTCAHFEPVKRTEIENGFHFEMRGTGIDNNNGKAMVGVEYQDDGQEKECGKLYTIYLQYSEDDMGPLEDKSHFRGEIPVPESRYFVLRRQILFNAEWKCCALEGDSEDASESASESDSESDSESMEGDI
jgi:hypothetical protein